MRRKDVKRGFLQDCGKLLSDYESAIVTKVGALSDYECRLVSRALRELTPTNCWWATYRCKPVVEYALEERTRMRKAMRRKK
jgi:hypothetical protein